MQLEKAALSPELCETLGAQMLKQLKEECEQNKQGLSWEEFKSAVLAMVEASAPQAPLPVPMSVHAHKLELSGIIHGD